MYERDLKVLLIDDDHDDAEIFKWHLEKVPSFKSTLVHVTDPEAADAQNYHREADATFLDYRLGGQTALDVLRGLREAGDMKPVVILTGQGDERVAARLMRAGADEYLTKDELSPERLREVIDEALKQYQQRLDEKQLRNKVDSLGEACRQLEQERSDDAGLLTRTVVGSAKTMVEMLRFGQPQVLPVVARLKTCVKKMLAQARFEPDWRINLATTLSHVGCIAVSQETCAAYLEGLPLTGIQRAEFARHPHVGHDLVAMIPRFDEVALMILFQSVQESADDLPHDDPTLSDTSLPRLTAEDFQDDRTFCEAQILRVAVAYDWWLRRGVSPRGALSRLRSHSQFDNSAVGLLEASLGVAGNGRARKPPTASTRRDRTETETRKLSIWQLASGMVLAEDLTTADGTALVLGNGQALTESMLDHLREFMTRHELPQMVTVFSNRSGASQKKLLDVAAPA